MISAWPPLPPTAYVSKPLEALPFPLEQETCRLFALGRHALYAGVRACGLEPGDEVLVPDYHHGSEIGALIRADLTCVFYPLDDRLEPIEDAVDALRSPRTRALLLIHYFGIPQDGPRWRRACDERGLLLFEDVAQGWLGRAGAAPLGASGHLSIFCLYKTFGLPDGAALWLSPQAGCTPPEPAPSAGSGAAALLRKHAAWLLQPVPARPPALTSRLVPETAFSLGQPRGPSRATTALLRRAVHPDAARRRRENYELLRRALADAGGAEAPPAPEGASPFVFPLATSRKDHVLESLRRAGVRALDFWSMPHPSLQEPSARASELRARIVGLPVHQELPRDAAEQIVAAVRTSRRAPRGSPTIEVRRSLDPLPGWNELASAAGDIFATWEWRSTWWRHFGRDRPLAVVVSRTDEGRLKAVLPLYQARSRPVAVARFVGYGTADVLRPICAPADVEQTLGLLRETLAELPFRCDVFFADQLPDDLAGAAALGGTRLGQIPTLTLDSGGTTWEEYVGSRGAKLQKTVRRLQRKLAEEHVVSYRLAGEATRLDEDVETLFDLHARRWGTSTFLRERAFHDELAPRALRAGWLRLWIQEIDGEPSAAWYGFRFGGAESFYQSGWDPRWARHSIGLLLLLHTIRAAIEDGVDEYRFLRGGEQYKWRLATRDSSLETVGVPLSPLGSTAVSVASRFGPTPDERRLAGVYRALAALAR